MEQIKNNKVVAAILAALIAGLTAFSTGLFGGEAEETPAVEEVAPATPASTDVTTPAAPAVEAAPTDAAAVPAASETK